MDDLIEQNSYANLLLSSAISKLNRTCVCKLLEKYITHFRKYSLYSNKFCFTLNYV